MATTYRPRGEGEGSPVLRWLGEAFINRNNRHMANKNRFTAQQVIDALQTTKGMVYLAAKQLKCDPDTVMNYCKRYPTVEAAKVAARGELLDVAELKLWAAVHNGDAWAIAFALKTIGKGRGYVERQEHSGSVTHEVGTGLSGLLKAFGGHDGDAG
jgi:hypothetical protein